MKLTRKLVIAMWVAILAVLGINSFIRVAREVELFEADIQRDGRVLGRAVAGAAERMWGTVGPDAARELVADANLRQSHVRIRWVSLEMGAPGRYRPDAPLHSLHRASGERVLTMRIVPPEGGPGALYTYVPLDVPDGPRSAVELRESLADEDAYVSRVITQTAIATLVLLVLGGILVTGLGVVFVGRPVRKLVETARRIGAGDLETRVDLRQKDEIGELAREMNAMSVHLVEARDRVANETAAKLAAVEQLRRADRLTTVGKLAAGLAHEIGTPLNVITGYASLVAEDAPEGSASREHAKTISEQARRVAAIIRQLIDFARQRPPRKAPEELGALTRRATSLLDPLAQKRGVTLEVKSYEGELCAHVDAGQIEQVVTNLVVNAMHAMPAGGVVTTGIERAHTKPPPDHAGPEDDYARLFVEDRGDGIPADILPRIFEPFFTTKDTGEGTGLGLSVAHGIVKEHGGWIDVRSTVGRGSRFEVYLPMARAA